MATLGQRMVGAMQADARTFQDIEADPSALPQAVTVIVVAGVAALIGNLWRIGIVGGLLSMCISLIGYAIFALLIVVIGTKVMPEPTTKADFQEAFRVIGFAAAPGVFNVLAIIPFLGPLISFVISIWMLVIGVIAVREVLDYTSTGRAFIVCLLAWLAYFIVTAVLGAMLLGGAIMRSVFT